MADIPHNSEYLHTTGASQQELVLLHGWSSSPEVWRPLAASLRGWANITLIDIADAQPVDGQFVAADLAALESAILARAPQKAVYIGWSLGGQLAARLARSQPGRVSALITICSNPRFVADASWPGMAPEKFAAFREHIVANPVSALRRFDVLQAMGADNVRSIERSLAAIRGKVEQENLLAGLALLETLDLRSSLLAISQPQLHLYSGSDAIVPDAVFGAVESLLGASASAQVALLSGLSHAAPLTAADEVANVIDEFLSVVFPPATRKDIPAALAKADIAESFSRAAKDYDSVAHLQREVGTRLLGSIDDRDIDPSLVVDLGCGTGYFYPALSDLFPGASYLGIDLAPGMIDYARAQSSGRARSGRAEWLVADAENLPLATNSVDLIFSSLAIQWCHNLPQLFAELSRALKPGGRCVFTSLGPATLKELRGAWAAVDDLQHVNTFLPSLLLREAAHEFEGASLTLKDELFVLEYDRVRDLLSELKTLGAHNMNAGRQVGLTGRKALQGMLGAYEDWREDGMLPATYEVLFGVLEKT